MMNSDKIFWFADGWVLGTFIFGAITTPSGWMYVYALLSSLAIYGYAIWWSMR